MSPQFIDFLYSSFLSLFSHLVALFIVGCVSGGSPFRHVCHSRCVELVSWSFGLFYSELCDSSLAMSALQARRKRMFNLMAHASMIRLPPRLQARRKRMLNLMAHASMIRLPPRLTLYCDSEGSSQTGKRAQA
ncbi:hypothetical protein F2Q69_00004493 [Brassica cretica]|uniref:Secreted protein n=1 Tax=Brassica cretica TaxID=69181 RepID=A0A8S9PFU7_BRACR|nr:hypothetical protein F2Q69_00004493 [Brassica cretica]